MKYRYSILQCIINGYETIKEVENPQDDVEYVLVTNDRNAKSNTWKIICDDKLTGKSAVDDVFYVRYHQFEYCSTNICVWLDGNTKVLNSLDSLIQKFNDEKYEIALMPHPIRYNFIDEMKMWLNKRGYTQEMFDREIAFYQKANYDLKYRGMFQTCVSIKRNDKICKDIDIMTYALINYIGTEDSIDRLDQTCFSFVMNRYFNHLKVLPLSEQIISSSKLCAMLHKSNTPIPKNLLTYYNKTHDNLQMKDYKFMFNNPIECYYL